MWFPQRMKQTTRKTPHRHVSTISWPPRRSQVHKLKPTLGALSPRSVSVGATAGSAGSFPRPRSHFQELEVGTVHDGISGDGLSAVELLVNPQEVFDGHVPEERSGTERESCDADATETAAATSAASYPAGTEGQSLAKGFPRGRTYSPRPWGWRCDSTPHQPVQREEAGHRGVCQCSRANPWGLQHVSGRSAVGGWRGQEGRGAL